MKYDQQLSELQRILPVSQNILVVLPKDASIDHLASGLALYLALKQSNKFAVVASEKTLQVSHTNLYGVGSIQNDIHANGIGNFVLTIGGAVDSTGKAIFEKVDYSIEGNDLKLVFPIVPGHRFEATHITPKFEGGNFDLIFAVGVNKLEDLGNLYSQHQEIFSSAHLVNVNKSTEASFGTSKIIDPNASSLSEMIGLILPSLGLKADEDISTNILTGIFEATANLQQNTTADTFEVIAQSLRNGGKRPDSPSQQVSKPETQVQSNPPVSTQPVQEEKTVPAQESSQTFYQPVAGNQEGPTFDFTQMYKPSEPIEESDDKHDNFTVPQVVDVGSGTHERESTSEQTYSGNESEADVTPEEDWLTPKIFSGKSIG